MENIEEVRRREVLLIRRSAFVRLVAEILNMSSPIIVAIVTFTLYTLIDPVNNLLTPQIAVLEPFLHVSNPNDGMHSVLKVMPRIIPTLIRRKLG